MTEQLAMASVAFSFVGMCVGYWMCLAVNRPRNDAPPQVPDRRFDLSAEIERTRREVAALKRQKRAVELRENGLTFSAIGLELGGVSRERARQLYTVGMRAVEAENHSKNLGWAVKLSARAHYTIADILEKSDFTPEEVAEISSERLLKNPNCGKKTVSEIEQAVRLSRAKSVRQ
jgi:hypothetical protein